MKELQAATAAAQKTVDHKKEATKSKKKLVEEMQALLEAAKTLSAKSSTGGTIESGSCSPRCSTFSEANNAQIVEAVKKIVEEMFNPDVVYECMEFYTGNGALEPAAKAMDAAAVKLPSLKALDEFCRAKFQLAEKRTEADINRVQKTIDDLKSQKK